MSHTIKTAKSTTKKCRLFHKWGKWKRVSPNISSMEMTYTHKTICQRCGEVYIAHVRDANEKLRKYIEG